MNNIINIYSSDKKIIAQVNLDTKSIQVDKNNQTPETIPQAYAIHFLMNNFESKIVKNGIHRFNGLSNLSLLIARQVLLQQGNVSETHFQNQSLESLTDEQYIALLTNQFLSGENF